MIQNEAVAANRTREIYLTDEFGNGLAGLTFSAGEVKLRKHGGAWANVTALPAEITGGVAGLYALVFTQPEVDTLGPFTWSVVKTNVATYIDNEQVVEQSAATLTASQIWNYNIEDGYTAQDYIRGFASALIWKVAGVMARNPVFRAANGIKQRIISTISPDGRTAVTFDPDD